jgi:NAD-dependent deacetylase sirtuin 5
LRPGVVWFGEQLPSDVLDSVDDFMDKPENIDLILVIGTSARVYPAAEYVDLARAKGARVAIINMDMNDMPAGGLYRQDWFFQGDAAEIVPELLKSVIGEVSMEEVGDAADDG